MTDIQYAISSQTVIIEKLHGRSLHLFSQKNAFRVALYKLYRHPAFDQIVLVLIFASTVLLIIDDGQDFVSIINKVCTILFMVEATVKIIVLGFACNGSKAYLKSNWNIVDLIIVLSSSLAFLDQDIGFLKVVRMFRVLRPLRLVNRFPQMRIAIESIFQSVPQYSNLLLIIFMTNFLFSILGTSLFKGKFSKCSMDNVPEEQRENSIYTKWDCYDMGGEWYNEDFNFDNVLNSMITLFVAMTTEGWVETMWAGVDAHEIDLMPKKNNATIYVNYFIFFMTFQALIILNLFVGVVIDSNSREKEKLLNNNKLTPLQEEYVDIITNCLAAKPSLPYISTGKKLQDSLHAFANGLCFERIITGCIIINTVFMAMPYIGMSEGYGEVLEFTNSLFTTIYIFEAILLIYVDWRNYFADEWRRFDFFIVVVAVLGLVVKYSVRIEIAPITIIIRSFRIMRVLKMVKQFKSLRKIFNTFILALPTLTQVGSLLVLLLVIYSVLGMSLFANVKQR